MPTDDEATIIDGSNWIPHRIWDQFDGLEKEMEQKSSKGDTQ